MRRLGPRGFTGLPNERDGALVRSVLASHGRCQSTNRLGADEPFPMNIPGDLAVVTLSILLILKVLELCRQAYLQTRGRVPSGRISLTQHAHLWPVSHDLMRTRRGMLCAKHVFRGGRMMLATSFVLVCAPLHRWASLVGSILLLAGLWGHLGSRVLIVTRSGFPDLSRSVAPTL